MPNYYEALPIFRAAMDTAVRVDRAVQRFLKGHKYVIAYLFEPLGSGLEE